MHATCLKHSIEYPVRVYKIGGQIPVRLGTCPECDTEKAAAEARQGARRLERIVRRSRVGPMYHDAELEGFKTHTPGLEQARDAVAELIETKKGKVVLLGRNGTGKTHLASVAVLKLAGQIWTMSEISARIRASYMSNANESEYRILQTLSDISMLAIDEIGRTRKSEHDTDWLGRIIDKRHTWFRPLILISNKHARSSCRRKGCADCFENYLDDGSVSRLAEGTKVIYIEAKDFRLGYRQYVGEGLRYVS